MDYIVQPDYLYINQKLRIFFLQKSLRILFNLNYIISLRALQEGILHNQAPLSSCDRLMCVYAVVVFFCFFWWGGWGGGGGGGGKKATPLRSHGANRNDLLLS